MNAVFDEYDLRRLKAARNELQNVLDYNYGHNPTRRCWKRLDTIVSKLSELIALIENSKEVE